MRLFKPNVTQLWFFSWGKMRSRRSFSATRMRPPPFSLVVTLCGTVHLYIYICMLFKVLLHVGRTSLGLGGTVTRSNAAAGVENPRHPPAPQQQGRGLENRGSLHLHIKIP
ncbi:unnamed protein product, partial [Ectocarpus sp. 4 AP-2014]